MTHAWHPQPRGLWPTPEDVAPLADALRAVLALHRYRIADNGQDWCDDCQDGPWPCATVGVITAALGVTL